MFLNILQNSQENTCARSSFLIKLQTWGLRPEALLRKRLWHRCVPVNFVKFLRTYFFTEHLRTTASIGSKVEYFIGILCLFFDGSWKICLIFSPIALGKLNLLLQFHIPLTWSTCHFHQLFLPFGDKIYNDFLHYQTQNIDRELPISNLALHKKRSFPLRISQVFLTEEILNGKLQFLWSAACQFKHAHFGV